MLIDGQFNVAAPPARVLALLFDARLMASCLPGCESLEALDDDRYRAVVVITLAGIRARFDLLVEIAARDMDGIRAVTRGEEGGNASTLQATSEVRLAPVAGGTRVDYRSEVAVTGRLGRFALGMMKKKAQSVGDEFAVNLQTRLAAGEARLEAADASASAPAIAPSAAAEAPTDAASSWRRLVAWLLHLFGRRKSAPH
jgi:hypothetical protein